MLLLKKIKNVIMFCKNIITFFNLVIKYSYSLILYLEEA